MLRGWVLRKRKSGTYLSDTLDHVFDEGCDGSYGSSLLVHTEPHADADEVALLIVLVLLQFPNLNKCVGKILGHGSSGSLNCDFSRLHRNLN
jgi:hypothetical protein